MSKIDVELLQQSNHCIQKELYQITDAIGDGRILYIDKKEVRMLAVDPGTNYPTVVTLTSMLI